jgi:hypothetical protein
LVKTSIIDFSENISPDVNAVFSLNPSQYSRKEITRKLDYNAKDLAIPEQVHSTVVEFARFPGRHPAADGLVTTNSNILLTLKVADCVPVYLYEPRKNMIGLVHSGWRGTVGKIVPNAIQLMQKNGAETGEIRCFLGPAIGICCYEVGVEVAHKFDDEAKMKLEDRKWKVGLHDQISLQLASSGILEENIQTSDMCTYESRDCHSYRRDGDNVGRMFAFMELKN